MLAIFTLSDANNTARPLLSPSLVLQQCLSHCSIAAIGVGSQFQRVSPLSWQKMWRPADSHGAGEGLRFYIYIWILRQQEGRVSHWVWLELNLKAHPRWHTSSNNAPPSVCGALSCKPAQAVLCCYRSLHHCG